LDHLLQLGRGEIVRRIEHHQERGRSARAREVVERRAAPLERATEALQHFIDSLRAVRPAR